METKKAPAVVVTIPSFPLAGSTALGEFAAQTSARQKSVAARKTIH